MTRDEWIAAFAERLDIEPPDPTTADLLLELAGMAAHDSERTAAPIACYLVGRVGLEVDAAMELAQAVTPRE